MRLVGRETGFVEEGLAEAARLEAGFDKIREVVAKIEQQGAASPPKKQKVAFLEWLEPLFNGGHWVPDLVRSAGGHYTMAEPGERQRFCDMEIVECTRVAKCCPYGMR